MNSNQLLQSNTALQYLSSNATCFGSTNHHRHYLTKIKKKAYCTL